MSLATSELPDDPVLTALEQHLHVLDATRADLGDVGRVRGTLLRLYGADPAETPNQLDRATLTYTAALTCTSAALTSALLVVAVIGFGLGVYLSLLLVVAGLAGVALMIFADRIVTTNAVGRVGADATALIAWQPTSATTDLGADDPDLRMRLQRALYPERPRPRRRVGVVRAVATVLAATSLAFGVDMAVFKQDVNGVAQRATLSQAQQAAYAADADVVRVRQQVGETQSKTNRQQMLSVQLDNLRQSVRAAGFNEYTGCPRRARPTQCEQRLAQLHSVKDELDVLTARAGRRLQIEGERRLTDATRLADDQRRRVAALRAEPDGVAGLSFRERSRKVGRLMADDVFAALTFLLIAALLTAAMLAGPLLRRRSPSEYERRQEQRARLHQLIFARKRFIISRWTSTA